MAAAAAALLGLAACGQVPASDDTAPASHERASKPEPQAASGNQAMNSDDLTEAMVDTVIAGMSPKQLDDTCLAVEALTPEAGYEAFKQGYGAEVPGVDSHDLYDEFLTRC